MHMQSNDEICRKLEFYLQVYFAIFPMHPCNKHSGDINKLKNELNIFKTYLDEERANFSQFSEFLPFYALPFVPNPHVKQNKKHI